MRFVGVGITWAMSLIAAYLAFVALTQGPVTFVTITGVEPALTLAFGLTPLGAPFLALVAILAIAVGAWCLRYDRPTDAVLIAGFVAAIVLVLVARSVTAFLLAWELMSLVSAFLVAADHRRRDVRRATFLYLAVAQSGALCILVAFVLLASHAPAPTFSAIAESAASLGTGTRNAAFWLALLGFGSKAGLMPLHFWLPRAHPVAPAGASALLSGAMLKVAVYGLCIVAFELAAPAPVWWGIALVAVGTVSAIGGVLYELQPLLRVRRSIGAAMMRHSLGIRHLVCGSCNGCEHEVNALTNAFYDITQEGWDIVASPRHADVITVTGPMTEAMRRAARETVDATPTPRVIVAIGDCAVGEGPWAQSPEAGDGAVVELDATIAVRGCPPTPGAICAALTEAARTVMPAT